MSETKRETISREYKSFHLNDKLNNSLLLLCKNKNWHHPQMYDIYNSAFMDYLNKYVEKYGSIFFNSAIDYGTLNIGVDDDGNESGFILTPFIQHNFNVIESHIKNIIMKKLEQHFDDRIILESMKYKIMDSVKISVKKLDKNYECGMKQILQDFKIKNAHYNKIMKRYNKKRKQRSEKLFLYERAINVILNIHSIRMELIEYIKKSKKYDETNMAPMFDMLNSEKKIEFEYGQIFDEKAFENKIPYWITKFRDEKKLEILKHKINKPDIKKPNSPYWIMLRNLDPIRNNMKNQGIEFGVLEITFPGRKTLNKYFMLRQIQHWCFIILIVIELAKCSVFESIIILIAISCSNIFYLKLLFTVSMPLFSFIDNKGRNRIMFRKLINGEPCSVDVVETIHR